MMRRGMKPVTDPRAAPGARHPLVVVHPETGRQTLLLGRRRNGYILGLSPEESDARLDELRAHATRPAEPTVERTGLASGATAQEENR
jgi:taurine dioxygenase